MRNNEDNQTTFGIILVIGFTIMGPVMDTFAKLAANEIPIGQISFCPSIFNLNRNLPFFWSYKIYAYG